MEGLSLQRPAIQPATHSAFVALGANLPSKLGSPQQAVVWALAQLAELPATQLLTQSNLYATAPLVAPGQTAGGDYINAVARLGTQHSPLQLLNALQAIEYAAGRQRSSPNAPRVLDLDLLSYDDLILSTPRLVLPHPRMQQRAFVLRPLYDIAPERVSPAWLQAVAGQRIEVLQDQ